MPEQSATGLDIRRSSSQWTSSKVNALRLLDATFLMVMSLWKSCLL